MNGEWSEANVPNIGYVARILNTYYPSTNLPAGLNDNQRAAAVQAAIWFFTDGYVVSRRGPPVLDRRSDRERHHRCGTADRAPGTGYFRHSAHGGSIG